MEVNELFALIECLTGSPVKGTTETDKGFLRQALSNDRKRIDVSQFNELLLLANKDRVTPPFFAYFFSTSQNSYCRIADMEDGVLRFQKTALLCFGNFLHAYRRLSRATTQNALLQEIGRHACEPNSLIKELKQRQPKVLDIEPISRDETYLIGYLSKGQIVAEDARAQWLLGLLKGRRLNRWTHVQQAIKNSKADKDQKKALLNLVSRFLQKTSQRGKPNDLQKVLEEDIKKLRRLSTSLDGVQQRGDRNSDVYLTWDHMDVYFATSMRKRWEYEDLFDFVQKLMRTKALAPLKRNLRYFDPTQSFERNRIDKGLVESLMLKRAACTVYSVQDSDTLGKDSELAATLAQGKPVIAYAPEITVAVRTRRLVKQRPSVLKDRLQFVLHADESFAEEFGSEIEFIRDFLLRLDEFEGRMLWASIADERANAFFSKTHATALRRFCQIIARSEKRIYDKRAKTLIESHPLAIQVNLRTGVANGVLVVRDIQICGELIRRILTNELDFEVNYDNKSECWVLKETLTKSVYRVVTHNPKLTNCFWNFYLRENERFERNLEGAIHGR